MFSTTVFSARAAFWSCAGALALGTMLLLAAGPAPQLIYPSDDVVYLDACHRASLGQWLGRDYTSPIGPAALLPTTLAMKIGGADVRALANGSALTWLAYGILASVAARPRMDAWLAGAFALFVAGTAAAPYTLDFGAWNEQSYGMLYNRLAWAALCPAAAAALLPRSDRCPSSLVPTGLGACAVWLWALKPNYLLILLPLVLYHWLHDPRRLTWIARATGGALVMLGLIWACVRFSPLGYFETHVDMARQAAQQDASFYGPARSLRENVGPVLALAAIWWLVLRPAGNPFRARLGLAIGAVIICTLLANLTNNQFSEIPLWGALGWLAAAHALANPVTSSRSRIVGIASVACGLAFTWQPLGGIAYSFAWNKFRAPGFPPAQEVASPAWRGMPMRPVPGESADAAGNLESPGSYATWLNDGLALLARSRPTHGSILCLDWTNPFPFATGTLPAAGDQIAWHVGRYIGPQNHPDVERLAATAGVVMEPRRSIQPGSLAFKQQLFAPLLAASFTLAGESAQWRLWLRRNDATARVSVP